MPDFSLSIAEWFRQNKRDLPWRHTNDPYKIWLSEIILQQTRVDQGLAYYNKFVSNYPSVTELANASEQDVLNDWQGLGYYSRARNLHLTAKIISTDLNAVFPNTYEEIIKLKGIGPYTAAAISSIAFSEERAVVDGNVYRVLSRYFGIETPIDSTIGQKEFQELANELIAGQIPGEHNQALMEFGAIQCTPQKPDCEHCNLMDSCFAYNKNKISQLPVKQGKTKVRDRYIIYSVNIIDNKIAIQKRVEEDIWKHLFEFPRMELNDEIEMENFLRELDQPSVKMKHVLSHQRIHAYFVRNLIPRDHESHKLVELSDLHDYPFPVLISKYFESHLFNT